MAVTTIPWNDGSGDNLYLTYSSASGNQEVVVTSDANTGHIERTREVVFTAGNVTATLTAVQAGRDITIITRGDVAITDNDVAVGYE